MFGGKQQDSKLDTVIGPGSAVKGDFRISGGMRLDGQLEGKLDLDGGFLAGPKSYLKGELYCRDAVIAGQVEGNIHAKEGVELQAGARVIGNIECKFLVVQRGSFFQGSCVMSTDGSVPQVSSNDKGGT